MRNTRRKFAACEPCRASKVACDHARPCCTRCVETLRQAECVYRQSPFKKNKPAQEKSITSSPNILSRIRSRRHSDVDVGNRQEPNSDVSYAAISKPHRYPNPGYQGSFSHSTILGHLMDSPEGSSGDFVHGNSQPRGTVREVNIERGTALVEEIDGSVSIASCVEMIRAWAAKGSNLAVARPFIPACIDSVGALFANQGIQPVKAREISRSLFLGTSQLWDVAASTSLEAFTAQFCHERSRWETLGLFFTAASRAALEMTSLASDKERRELQRLGMNLSDRCLDIALSLDCLNDLQLLLQYENWILHSFVDGDQSYHSWKRLGDVISSIYALGHHQQTDHDDSNTPLFLLDLRRQTFAIAYSADKNVSLFLGRPPRIHRRYCNFVLPGSSSWGVGSSTTTTWRQDVDFDFVSDIRWAGMCAILKEDIVELFSGEEIHDYDPKVRDILEKAHSQWQALPPSFRLETPLKQCDKPPVVRDFMLNAKLNHLHVLCLLRMAVTRNKPASDPELVSTSVEILHLIVEAIMQKDYLVNSGTSLVWKVAYYGLFAAGVISLWLLNHASSPQNFDVDTARVFQCLSVLVMEMEAGVLIDADDPNYKLLVDASKTIGRLLSQLIVGRLSGQGPAGVLPIEAPALADAREAHGWNAWDGNAPQDFESEFWLNLAEHPFLARAHDL